MTWRSYDDFVIDATPKELECGALFVFLTDRSVIANMSDVSLLMPSQAMCYQVAGTQFQTVRSALSIVHRSVIVALVGRTERTTRTVLPCMLRQLP